MYTSLIARARGVCFGQCLAMPVAGHSNSLDRTLPLCQLERGGTPAAAMAPMPMPGNCYSEWPVPYQPQQPPYLLHQDHQSKLISDRAPRTAPARPSLPRIIWGCPFPPHLLHTAGCSTETEGIAREDPRWQHSNASIAQPVHHSWIANTTASTCSSHPPPA